jgi:RNA polymerase sigma-54 factor
MRLSFGHEQRMIQGQRQILAPKMIQSMEVLQLPIAALEERIDQELMENPLLEKLEEEQEEEDAARVEENPDAPTTEEKELVVGETKDNAEDFERLENMGEDLPDFFEDRPRTSSNRMEEESQRQADLMANMADRPETLADHLVEQLTELELPEAVRQMAERIIYSLDDKGYLSCPLEELLDANGGPQQLEAAQQALSAVQRLDPAGVGARDLRECLLLQLEPDMLFYEEMQTILESHFDDLEHNRLPQIQRRTGYTMDVLQHVIHELARLDMRPGARFGDTHVPAVVPDVYLEAAEGGGYRVQLEEGRIPRLRISSFYRELLQNGQATEAEREFIRRKINSAQWLIESIEQRRNTLSRVAQAIVDHQAEFLSRGPEHIEPLKMQQIADKVKVHVTTVSRAVDDKWIQTPRGIFPLKRFFGGGTKSADGGEVAWDAVRLKLQEIIDGEDKQNPYSDDDLVEQLARHGLTVARRTVTKYRKAMSIASSRQRRDWSLGGGEPSAKEAGDKPAAGHRPVESAAAEERATDEDRREGDDSPAGGDDSFQ